MRTPDLLLAGLSSLHRQKLRTTLTTLGVTIGIATLVASVSVGLGVRLIIEDGFKKQHRLREILVYPGFDRTSDEFAGVPEAALKVEGEMTDERRERIKRRLAREWRSRSAPPSPKPLTEDRLREFTTWDHVIAVRPGLTEQARFTFRGLVMAGDCTGFTGDPENLARVLEFGRPPAEGTGSRRPRVSLYRWGIRSDADVRGVLGQTMRIDFRGPRACGPRACCPCSTRTPASWPRRSSPPGPGERDVADGGGVHGHARGREGRPVARDGRTRRPRPARSTQASRRR